MHYLATASTLADPIQTYSCSVLSAWQGAQTRQDYGRGTGTEAQASADSQAEHG